MPRWRRRRRLRQQRKQGWTRAGRVAIAGPATLTSHDSIDQAISRGITTGRTSSRRPNGAGKPRSA